MRYPLSHSKDYIAKAAVAAGSATDATWAGPLASVQRLTDSFLEFVRPQTIIGKIAGLRRVPFNVSVPAQTAAGNYSWVAQGAPAPVSALALSTVALGMAKAAGILVLTRELVKLSTPSADVVTRDELAEGVAQFTDAQFVDPAIAPVANVSPGSVTNGITPIASAGTTAANAATDINALVRAFVAANPDVESAVLLMSPANAMALAATGNYPDLRITGGFVAGIPTVTSAAVGDRLIMLDPRGILYADDGGIELSMSDAAAVQMDSTPADPATASTVYASLWQQNLVGVKVVRFINWTRARATAVRFVSGAAYV